MANITATFSQIEYKEKGVITVPVTLSESVIVPSKTVFAVERVSGDALAGIEYVLLGEGTAYELAFTVPPDRKGSFRVSAAGDVLKVSSQVWDNVVATPVTINYDTSEPRLIDFDVPADYTPGETFDVILQFDPECTLNDPVAHFGDDHATYLDFFIFEGADLGVPNFYRKTDNTYPTLPLPDDLGTDWTQADLQTVDATLYLLRWDPVVGNPQGIFNMTLKPGFVRGPVR